MDNVTYAKVQSIHGDQADAVSQKICAIHGGLSFVDFKSHAGGIDVSGCSEADQAKIQGLLSKKTIDKDGK